MQPKLWGFRSNDRSVIRVVSNSKGGGSTSHRAAEKMQNTLSVESAGLLLETSLGAANSTHPTADIDMPASAPVRRAPRSARMPMRPVENTKIGAVSIQAGRMLPADYARVGIVTKMDKLNKPPHGEWLSVDGGVQTSGHPAYYVSKQSPQYSVRLEEVFDTVADGFDLQFPYDAGPGRLPWSTTMERIKQSSFYKTVVDVHRNVGGRVWDAADGQLTAVLAFLYSLRVVLCGGKRTIGFSPRYASGDCEYGLRAGVRVAKNAWSLDRETQNADVKFVLDEVQRLMTESGTTIKYSGTLLSALGGPLSTPVMLVFMMGMRNVGMRMSVKAGQGSTHGQFTPSVVWHDYHFVDNVAGHLPFPGKNVGTRVLEMMITSILANYSKHSNLQVLDANNGLFNIDVIEAVDNVAGGYGQCGRMFPDLVVVGHRAGAFRRVHLGTYLIQDMDIDEYRRAMSSPLHTQMYVEHLMCRANERHFLSALPEVATDLIARFLTGEMRCLSGKQFAPCRKLDQVPFYVRPHLLPDEVASVMQLAQVPDHYTIHGRSRRAVLESVGMIERYIQAVNPHFRSNSEMSGLAWSAYDDVERQSTQYSLMAGLGFIPMWRVESHGDNSSYHRISVVTQQIASKNGKPHTKWHAKKVNATAETVFGTGDEIIGLVKNKDCYTTRACTMADALTGVMKDNHAMLRQLEIKTGAVVLLPDRVVHPMLLPGVPQPEMRQEFIANDDRAIGVMAQLLYCCEVAVCELNTSINWHYGNKGQSNDVIVKPICTAVMEELKTRPCATAMTTTEHDMYMAVNTEGVFNQYGTTRLFRLCQVLVCAAALMGLPKTAAQTTEPIVEPTNVTDPLDWMLSQPRDYMAEHFDWARRSVIEQPWPIWVHCLLTILMMVGGLLIAYCMVQYVKRADEARLAEFEVLQPNTQMQWFLLSSREVNKGDAALLRYLDERGAKKVHQFRDMSVGDFVREGYLGTDVEISFTLPRTEKVRKAPANEALALWLSDWGPIIENDDTTITIFAFPEGKAEARVAGNDDFLAAYAKRIRIRDTDHIRMVSENGKGEYFSFDDLKAKAKRWDGPERGVYVQLGFSWPEDYETGTLWYYKHDHKGETYRCFLYEKNDGSERYIVGPRQRIERDDTDFGVTLTRRLTYPTAADSRRSWYDNHVTDKGEFAEVIGNWQLPVRISDEQYSRLAECERKIAAGSMPSDLRLTSCWMSDKDDHAFRDSVMGPVRTEMESKHYSVRSEQELLAKLGGTYIGNLNYHGVPQGVHPLPSRPGNDSLFMPSPYVVMSIPSFREEAERRGFRVIFTKETKSNAEKYPISQPFSDARYVFTIDDLSLSSKVASAYQVNGAGKVYGQWIMYKYTKVVNTALTSYKMAVMGKAENAFAHPVGSSPITAAYHVATFKENIEKPENKALKDALFVDGRMPTKTQWNKVCMRLDGTVLKCQCCTIAGFEHSARAHEALWRTITGLEKIPPKVRAPPRAMSSVADVMSRTEGSVVSSVTYDSSYSGPSSAASSVGGMMFYPTGSLKGKAEAMVNDMGSVISMGKIPVFGVTQSYKYNDKIITFNATCPLYQEKRVLFSPDMPVSLVLAYKARGVPCPITELSEIRISGEWQGDAVDIRIDPRDVEIAGAGCSTASTTLAVRGARDVLRTACAPVPGGDCMLIDHARAERTIRNGSVQAVIRQSVSMQVGPCQMSFVNAYACSYNSEEGSCGGLILQGGSVVGVHVGTCSIQLDGEVAQKHYNLFVSIADVFPGLSKNSRSGQLLHRAVSEGKETVVPPRPTYQSSTIQNLTF